MKRFGLLRRLLSLLRGTLARLMTALESRHPGAAYEAAIQNRYAQYARLREAVGRLAYLRSRIETRLQARHDDLALVSAALDDAAQSADQPRALSLLHKRRALETESAGMAERQRALAGRIEDAKECLQRLDADIHQLRAEQVEMLSRQTHAEARLQVDELMGRSAVHAGAADAALEHARAAILQLEAEVGLTSTAARSSESDLLAELRNAAARRTDLAELATMAQPPA